MANVKVVAVENGHDGKQYRNTGEEFEVDSARLKDGSTWFVKSSKPTVDSEPEPEVK